MDDKLRWLILVSRRGKLLDEEHFDMKNGLSGNSGESFLTDFVRPIIPAHWKLHADLWLNGNGPTQIDLMIVNESGIYLLNAKNYQASFEYQAGKAYYNGKFWAKDIFAHMQTSLDKVQFIHQKIGSPGRLEAVVAFVNPDYPVRIDESAPLRFCTRDTLLGFLQELMEAADRMAGRGLNIAAVYQQILQYEIDNPYGPAVLEDARYASLRKGILCAACHNPRVTVGDYHVWCECGHREPKRIAILRTIDEYALLRHHVHIRKQDLVEFFEGEVGGRYLKKILVTSDQYELLHPGRYAAYRNRYYSGDNSRQFLRLKR